MTLLVAALLALQGPTAKPTDPVAVVQEYLSAVQALDAKRMGAVLADNYRLFDTDGSSRPYDRALGAVIVEWERGMSTRWTFRILAVHGDTVTALEEEESDYFTLLGLERGVQVSSYVVRDGRIQESHEYLFVTAKSSQAEALAAFKAWFRANADRPEPELIGPDGGLRLTRASVRPMLYWLRKWRAAGRPGNSSKDLG